MEPPPISGKVIADGLDKSDREVDEVLVQRRSLRGNLCDDELICSVDKHVLAVDTQPQCNLSCAENVPLVAIMHGTIAEIGDQVACRPGLRIAAAQYVLDPTGGNDRRAVATAILHDQLADAGEIHRCRADATGAARRAE